MIWTAELGGEASTSPSIDGNGTVSVGCDNNTIYAISSGGAELWSYECGGALTSAPAIGPNGMLYIGCVDGKLYAFGP